jgi:GTPase SAR1 family protein
MSELKILHCKCPCAVKSKKCYNIVVVGVTGAGKTTFCDSLVNFFLDVDYYDEIRYKLVDERSLNSNDQTSSRTKDTVIYHLKNEWLKRGRL